MSGDGGGEAETNERKMRETVKEPQKETEKERLLRGRQKKKMETE